MEEQMQNLHSSPTTASFDCAMSDFTLMKSPAFDNILNDRTLMRSGTSQPSNSTQESNAYQPNTQPTAGVTVPLQQDVQMTGALSVPFYTQGFDSSHLKTPKMHPLIP
jgi:hypothetical protein